MRRDERRRDEKREEERKEAKKAGKMSGWERERRVRCVAKRGKIVEDREGGIGGDAARCGVARGTVAWLSERWGGTGASARTSEQAGAWGCSRVEEDGGRSSREAGERVGVAGRSRASLPSARSARYAISLAGHVCVTLTFTLVPFGVLGYRAATVTVNRAVCVQYTRCAAGSLKCLSFRVLDVARAGEILSARGTSSGRRQRRRTCRWSGL